MMRIKIMMRMMDKYDGQNDKCCSYDWLSDHLWHLSIFLTWKAVVCGVLQIYNTEKAAWIHTGLECVYKCCRNESGMLIENIKVAQDDWHNERMSRNELLKYKGWENNTQKWIIRTCRLMYTRFTHHAWQSVSVSSSFCVWGCWSWQFLIPVNRPHPMVLSRFW